MYIYIYIYMLSLLLLLLLLGYYRFFVYIYIYTHIRTHSFLRGSTDGLSGTVGHAVPFKVLNLIDTEQTEPKMNLNDSLKA